VIEEVGKQLRSVVYRNYDREAHNNS